MNYIDESVQIGANVKLGENLKVWSRTVIREFATIGDGTTMGIGVYVGPGVVIGKNCKIQNSAQIYEPTKISDNCFIGPGVIFANDKTPRAVNVDKSVKTHLDWIAKGANVQEGASIGAGAIIIGDCEIGAWSIVAAGAVVAKDIPPYSLVMGVPARQVGWVGEAGYRLEKNDSGYVCTKTGVQYVEVGGILTRCQ